MCVCVCVCAGGGHVYISLVSTPLPQLSSLVARMTLLIMSVIRTASEDSCSGELGTRLCVHIVCVGEEVTFLQVQNMVQRLLTL